MTENDIIEDEFGQKRLHIKIEYQITIDTLVVVMLYYLEKEHQNSINEKRNFNPRWDWWNRDRLLGLTKHFLSEYGWDIHSLERYFTAKQIHHGTAQRFVEELFPELVYDRQEYERRYEAFKRKYGHQ